MLSPVRICTCVRVFVPAFVGACASAFALVCSCACVRVCVCACVTARVFA